MAAHKHQPRWVMGRHPVVATCASCPKVMVNGGRWVSQAQADEDRRRIGWRGAL